MTEFRIGETDYYIKNRGGFNLVYLDSEVKKRIDRKTNKEVTSQKTETWYYGTLYQALSGFVRQYYEDATSLEDIKIRTDEAIEIVGEIMTTIEEADRDILKEWKNCKVSSN